MLKYKFEKEEKNEKVYIFFPEGNEDAPGKVVFGNDGTRKILEDSKEDFKQIYAMHALSGIDTNKKEGIVAWY